MHGILGSVGVFGMKAAWVVVVLAAAALVSLTEGFQPRRILFGRCSNEEQVPRAVLMTCANRQGVCEVRLGQTYNLRAIFISPINTTEVDSYVRWNWIFEVPLPGQERDSCNGEISCPVVAGHLTQFTYSLEIQNYWLRGEYPVIWSLTDKQTSNSIVCFKFKISII